MQPLALGFDHSHGTKFPLTNSLIFLVSSLVSTSGHNEAHLPQTSVPGPPNWATLDVIGANTLQTKFSPPLWDGGSPVTSYLVEWDKEAGEPEVQRIITSQNLYANEIQTITTSVPDVNEIQVIQTTATPQAEVQAITVSPSYGDATIDSAYSFALSLDTINTGGSLQYSGQISANAAADGSRSSIAQILENMDNVHGRPTVERLEMNPDGGHTYTVTFPMSMGNVPEMEVFMTDLPVSITTLQEGNQLVGSFRLEYMGELTADIPHDASAAEMQSHLESLDSIDAVSVLRSIADDQNGFLWEVEFLSDSNGGDIESMTVHGDGLRTSNSVGGAKIELVGGRDGSYIAGTFVLAFEGEKTNHIPFDAHASVVKEELEALEMIGSIHVERTPMDVVGGCKWTVSFLEDGSRLHRGDVQSISVESHLTGAPGQIPMIIVEEERKGTKQEVQTITIDGNGSNVDPNSSFRLRFEGEETGDILAMPFGGSTCLGSTTAKQIITSSTVDTSGVGGDDSVSHLTSFALTYERHTTNSIMANDVSCEETATQIAQELMLLPTLYDVAVSGSATDAGDEGCTWIVTFLSVMGNPELMKVTAYNKELSAGPGRSVTVGDEYSIIRDTIAISQPDDFKGDVNLIQSELAKLSTIGIVTVTPASAFPDDLGQCTWDVTFESKAGNVASIEVARSGTTEFSTEAELSSGNKISITDDTLQGTSTPVSGDFRLEFDGKLTGYMPYNASAELVKASLDALSTIGRVSVTRHGPDVNRCFIWDVTFVSDLGPLPLIVADGLDLKGTVPSISVYKETVGQLPPFDGPDYGSLVVEDSMDDVMTLIPHLKQGIPYYIRISASNALGYGPSIMPYPPFQIPYPQPPAPPSQVYLESKDGSNLAVTIDAPFHDGGDSISSYRVDYSTQPFVQERQRISLTCSPQSEVQTITTSASDLDEVQYLVIDSSYKGNGEILEVQRVMCDATGGTFALTLGDETAYIAHDADKNDIMDAFESMTMVDQVSIDFDGDTTTACAPYDGDTAGSFTVTFQSLFGMAGNLPLMIAEMSGLEGARYVQVSSVIDGDAPLGGSLKLSFSGAVSEVIDVSLDNAELAVEIEAALEALDTIQQDGVTVSAVDLVNGGYEKIFRIEFVGHGVGGNIDALVVVPGYHLVTGSSAAAFILTDGESYAARNGVDTVTSQVGNELSGQFRLRLRGHTTGRIPFNSSVDEMKARLEVLPNIGTVFIERSGPSKELAYTWTITFASNPGYFPPSARDVDLLEVINELETSVGSDTSAAIFVDTVREGDGMLEGKFQVSFNDGLSVETTRPLQNFISAEELKEELELLHNVGIVNVVRSESLVGYEWDIEFASCALKNGAEVCNDGNLHSLIVSDVSLQGCGGAILDVAELMAGSGPGLCPHLSNGVCSEEEPFNGEYPIEHNIGGLTLGTRYYVQARLRNSQSFGYRELSSPLNATPLHNPPGRPPPVMLIESSSDSITVGWEKPKDNGGKAVSGYELWMDTWSGGETFMVYDGTGNPEVMSYRLTTNDTGAESQIVETGRQYRFQVRAINNCDNEDPFRSCFGELSEVQLFTVRDPRPPLPPSMPRRDSLTRITSSSEATISLMWSPPIDNGGSPITGYILYMRDPQGITTNYALDKDVTRWQANLLHPGEMYRFHLVALNAKGKSGNSPTLSTLAAMPPGLNYDGEPEYSSLGYRPTIIDVQETSLTTKWSHLPSDITGGSPITGYKVYLYNVNSVSRSDDPIRQEIQYVQISSQQQLSGTFTLSFRGHETGDISTDATSDAVKSMLENLPSINVVYVDTISDGWSVTFLSEAGDLPLMSATSGRLLGDPDARVVVTEAVKGDIAMLLYDGSENPGRRKFEALNLVPDLGYAFKVAPVNAIGDGILSSASVVTIARAGASSTKTTASGSALSKGIAGVIREEQVITFLSDDCIADKLILSFEFTEQETNNLCGSTEDEFESELEQLDGVGVVHVLRNEVSSPSGHQGYSWTVVFISRMGDVPLLLVDRAQVGNGKDASGKVGLEGNYCVEFLKGQANEFTIEPKKASGAVVRDVTAYPGMEGTDIFFTELWSSDVSIVDGSHTWYADGGVSSYNALVHEEQVVVVPSNVGSFFLSMDTSESLPWGRIDGLHSKTRNFNGIHDVTEQSLQEALSGLLNVGQVHVARTSSPESDKIHFTITFKEVLGEYPLLTSSDPSISISRGGVGHVSVTEIQTITISADKPFAYEVQSIEVTTLDASFDLSFMAGQKTSAISCNFVDVEEANAATSIIEAELNELSSVKVRVDPTVTGNGGDADPWKFMVTFLEPIGPLPLLQSNNADVSQVIQGESTLSGSFVLSYEGEYTDDIMFDASARDVKAKLEALDSINEVEVKRADKYTGYQWKISFTGDAGNLPLVAAHDNVFEVQSIKTMGGQPTPLGGTFSLSYLDDSTPPMPFDSSADMIKSSLESLSGIDRVDVNMEVFDYGQCRWMVTFRTPQKPALLKVDTDLLSGTLDEASVSIVVDSKSPSLLANWGSPPMVVVEESVPGLPSYTGQYKAQSAGDYTLAVMQLESGGLNARYYDNQWLLDEPSIDRVDPTVNFNWGSGIITLYGRDYVSIRWWGKVRPSTSELYTFYLNADDGVRLFVDHEILLDMWEEHSVEKKAAVHLVAGTFHDVKVEYKELTGDAQVQLQWSSPSIRKQVIPPSHFFYSSHIVGSPFRTTISPGAADYPHSDFIDMPGENRSQAIAGEETSFYLQAKDSTGNNKATNGDAQGDLQSPQEQFTVDIIGQHTSASGVVTYLESGQYRVDYTIIKAGSYQVHVKTGGTDIYCGLGEENKCSPFALEVLPGETLSSSCEAESSFDPIDHLVEARAGEVGKIYLQAKDAFGNNRKSGGDDVLVTFKSVVNPDIRYRGNVVDRDDGTYYISYSIPLADAYLVSITLDGDPVKYCVGPSGKRWHSREYDGVAVYSSPSFCSVDSSISLNVIHHEMHAASSTIVEEEGAYLNTAVVGVETGFIVQSRDKFGNLRSGARTSNIEEIGDGKSDTFLISITGPSGHEIVTSSAVQALFCIDSSIQGYFRLSYGGRVSDDMPHDVSDSAMQVVLMSMHGSNPSVEVRRMNVGGNYQWHITFTDHLDLWSRDSLKVVPGSDGFDAVSNVMSVSMEASGGLYPVRYTLWEKGIYELSVFSGTSLVSGSSYTVEVDNGTPQASSSTASGDGLKSGVAGDEMSFEVIVRDQRQSEVQSIKASGTVTDFVNEVQRLSIVSNSGESFQIDFRGQTSEDIIVGLSTTEELKTAIEKLATVGQVSVTSDGTLPVIQKGDSLDIEFLSEHGSLTFMSSSGQNVVSKLVEGEAPFRVERQSFNCNADGGYIILSFNHLTATIESSDDISTFESKLTGLVGSIVSIVVPNDTIETVCSSSGQQIFADFLVELGNVEPIGINFDGLENGSMVIYGDGEEEHGAVNGISPIMGHFTISHDGMTTGPLSLEATADDVKTALEGLPTIGSVYVTKDVVGLRLDDDGQNSVPGTTSVFGIWSITFADERMQGCQPGSWDNCPSNIGDVSLLTIDASLHGTQKHPTPTIEVIEVRRGSNGNSYDNIVEHPDIEFSLTHDLNPHVGIGMAEVQSITCSYTAAALEAHDASGSFELSIMDKRIQIGADTTMLDLKLMIRDALGLDYLVATDGSSHSTVCHFDPNSPVSAVTQILFAEETGPLPVFYVHSEQNVVISVDNLVNAVDRVEYLGGGRYALSYTPTLSGSYSASIKINDEFIWTDMSSGVIVSPSVASARYSTHDSSLVTIAGKQASFHVISRDRFGNWLHSNTPNESSLVIDLVGHPDTCSGHHDNDRIVSDIIINELGVGSRDGHYQVAYTPLVAGNYRASILLRSRGGLLATYFRNQDFSNPLYGNDNHKLPPYHESPWCIGDDNDCDSTQVDKEISFHWGFGSPFPTDASFPMDSFSIIWSGDLKVKESDEYYFIARLNGGVRLIVGERVLIDYLPEANSNYLSSESIFLSKDEFYPIRIEYAHSTDEAHMQLLWRSSSVDERIVPSSVLYFSQHIGALSPSPFALEVIPGDVDVTSTAHGDGLRHCIALEECEFTIQAKDLDHNHKYNDGSNPGFQVSIVGTEGWAGEGRINGIASSTSPVSISNVSVESNDWELIGNVDVTHLSSSLIASDTNFFDKLSRADNVVINGMTYTVSSTGTFDGSRIPLSSPYLGPTMLGLPLYKASKSCATGTFTVKYIPSVRGSYFIDVTLPSVAEVQRVSTSVSPKSSLSGFFSVDFRPYKTYASRSKNIAFDATSEEFKTALESIDNIGTLEVSRHDCEDPSVTCTWDVTFLEFVGDAEPLLPNYSQLLGNDAVVSVEQQVKGRKLQSTSGLPHLLTVSPGQTNPTRTLAHGKGLVASTSGERSSFTIQPKDSFGNDRLPEQDSDLFAVYIYPEQKYPDKSFHVHKGVVTRQSDGSHTVDYIPGKSGYHTIAVIQAVASEKQIVTTSYNTKARGGTFKLQLGSLSTQPIPWDADEDKVADFLNSSMAGISNFRVEKRAHGLLNFQYVIHFDTAIGDVPNISVDTTHLLGSDDDWGVVPLVNGKFAHINLDSPQLEIQQIILQSDVPFVEGAASFTLTFKGRTSNVIPWDADSDKLRSELQLLSTVGDISVSLDIDVPSNSRSWTVTFDPHEGKSPDSLMNFGNLPPFEISVDGSITARVETIQDGESPYRMNVSPSAVSAENVVAYDNPGVTNMEGLSTGVYKSSTHFFIQARDAHSNDISDEPVGEVQIIETSATSQINGFFEVTFFGSTVRFDASSFTAEVEKGLQSIPVVGAVTVSSNSAKDLVIGKAVDVTKGLDTIIPNEELTEFVIGDWIRIGDQDGGQLFSIIEMSAVPPFTVTLSSSYLGESQSSANIYQHGTKLNRHGYQYIVTFDPTLGDVPEMHVDGTLLEGKDASVQVISCDKNVHQILRFLPLPSSSVEGHFYLAYKDERTRFLSVDDSIGDIKHAILSDISSIHSIYTAEVDDISNLGAKSLHLELDSFEGSADLLFAENYMISNGKVDVIASCPMASPQSPTFSTRSVAGRRGADLVASLSNAESSPVFGEIAHVSDGLYAASYKAPRVGQYSLEVQVAEFGGLAGEYFDNNELLDPPSFVQTDSIFDFSWADDDTESFSSIRWTGYIKPSFDETYSFAVYANGDLRLWIGDELIIDHQHEVREHIEVSNSTSNPLKANQLIDIKLEHRMNNESQMLRLIWQSTSQPSSVIDPYRLYWKSTHIDGSPFEVSPEAVEPSVPTRSRLEIADWDSLQVYWSYPNDDGGSEVTKYLVEYWDVTMYGETEKQQLHMRQNVAGGTFIITMSMQSVEVPFDASALELEERLESLQNIGDVQVHKMFEADVAVYEIEYLTNVSPVPIMNVNIPSEMFDNVEYCVCARGNSECDSGTLLVDCVGGATREGTISTQSVEVEVDSYAANSTDFSYTLKGLDQPSSILDGFGVRITAANVNGYGMPSPVVTLKPHGPPLPPAVVEIDRVPLNPSELTLHFTSVSSPDDRSSVVTSYFVEWTTAEDFTGSAVFSATLNLDSIHSERLSSYENVDKVFQKFLIQGLTPGLQYYVRIAAANEAGVGPSSRSFPYSLAPGSKPSDLEDQHGVSLSTVVSGDAVSVLESSSSLQLSWLAPVSNNGFAISSYLIEYWVESGTSEVQEISLHSSNGNEVRGTFALTYGGDTTDSMSINASSDDVQHALESLSTIRSVRVWRSGENPNYKWTVTFLSEYPSVSGLILVVDDTTELEDVLGGSPTLQVSLLTAGEYPLGYNSEVVIVDDALETHYHRVLTGLIAGQAYYVQVSAANDLGFGRPQSSTPRALAPPIQKPSAPRNVILRVASSRSLEVIFSKPESDGGDDVTLYRIEWDTNSTFDSSNNNSPIGSYSFPSPKTEVGCDPCMYQVAGLTKGQEYFVRVYAYNSLGYSIHPGLPMPRSLAPQTAPDPPNFVNISSKSDTAIQVTFPSVTDDGGAKVTKYKIEWNTMGYAAGMQSMNQEMDALLYSTKNVQSISLSGESDDIDGTFRIAFGGHYTDEIPVSSTAHDMKVALESLPTIGSTVVSQRHMPNGSIWAVTFLTNLGDGSKFGPIDSLTVSTDPDDSAEMFVTDTMESSGSLLLGTGARIIVTEEVSAFKGFEQQLITTQCTTSGGIMSGYFAISVDGVRTSDIPHDASALDLKHELENISSIGEVKVTRSMSSDGINSFHWSIMFVEKLGNVPLLNVHDHLSCSDGSATPLIYITEATQGILPRMNGPLAGETEIDVESLDRMDSTGDFVYVVNDLMRGMPYHVRVSAWNGAGDSYGRAQYSTPAILTPMDKPDPPSSVEMIAIDNSSIQISWNAALNKGGSHMITKYKAEVAEVVPGSETKLSDDSSLFYESFDVDYTPEVQAIILESSADDMGGFFVVNFMGESTPNIYTDAEADDIKEALEGISTIDSVVVSIYPHSQDFITTYGQRWIITFDAQRGNLPSMLIDSSSGQPSTIATGGTVSGSSSVIRVETISNGGLLSSFITPPVLDEGKLYMSRISSFNGVLWSDFTTSHNSISPSKSAPSPPRDVLVKVLSDTELGVSWKAPLFDGGASIAGYKIVWGDNDDMVPASQLFFLLDNLDPEESFLVSVTAFSSRGFSDPTLAKPAFCPMELIESISI